MKEKITLSFIAVVMIVIGCTILAHGQDINTENYNIEISTEVNSLSVVESLRVDVASNEIINFWIQDGATDITILIDGNNIEYYPAIPVGDNTYYCNISDLNITTDTIIEVTYSLDKDTSEFEKKLQYNTTLMSIKFDGEEIYTSNDVKSGTSLTIALLKETEGQIITKTVETIPSWIYIIIVVLIILLLIAFISSSRRQKSKKKKEITVGSKELLNTKKTLLMSLLKEIEKQHRAEEISDDTYHKLKEQYKQEAVEAMKQLEDMKSKIK